MFSVQNRIFNIIFMRSLSTIPFELSSSLYSNNSNVNSTGDSWYAITLLRVTVLQTWFGYKSGNEWPLLIVTFCVTGIRESQEAVAYIFTYVYTDDLLQFLLYKYSAVLAESLCTKLYIQSPYKAIHSASYVYTGRLFYQAQHCDFMAVYLQKKIFYQEVWVLPVP